MKDGAYKRYIAWGITVLVVVVLSIAFFFSLFKVGSLVLFAQKLIAILMPFIYGLTIAYLLLPVFNYFYKKLAPPLKKRMKNQRKAARTAKFLSTTISMVLAFIVVGALISMVLPQLVTSIVGLADTLPNNVRQVTGWLEDLLKNNPAIESTAMQFYNEGVTAFTGWIKTEMLPQLTSVMNGLLGTMTFIKNMFIAIIIAIYVLNSKELFAAQAKKLVYSCVKTPQANLIIDNVRFTHRVFGGFINGKLLDSLLIGLICFIAMSVLQFPYVMLISVIIGVTNIIPFFGPFIGAIPSALIILFVNPMQCLYFLIFVLVLQQFDGNILGPKILGDSTGLSSFWVMFAILLFGGLFGFVGMVVGVPFFAVFYSLVAGLVNRSLRKKAMPENTKDYYGLVSVDAPHHMRYESNNIERQTERQTEQQTGDTMKK